MDLVTPESAGYIKPNAAIALILHYVGSEFEAKQVIADGLHSGKVACVAEYIWETNVGDIYGDWTPRKHGDFLYEHDAEISGDFWSESLQWPKDTNHWRWDKSEFVIFTSTEDDDRLARIYFKNVRLLKKDVMSLVGRSNRSGGPKPDRERWALFWINILQKYTANFDWTTFDSPQELKRAFLDANSHDGAFSDNNIDFAVAMAWEYLVKRSARERLRSGLSVVSDQSLSDPQD